MFHAAQGAGWRGLRGGVDHREGHVGRQVGWQAAARPVVLELRYVGFRILRKRSQIREIGFGWFGSGTRRQWARATAGAQAMGPRYCWLFVPQSCERIYACGAQCRNPRCRQGDPNQN